MNITAFGRASLKVRDLENSVRFYSHVLRMPVLSASKHGKQIGLRVGTSNEFVLESAEDTEKGKQEVAHHFAFVVGNNPRMLEAAAAHLAENGIPFHEVAHEEYESLYLRDPDGHLIELYYWPEW